jgi:hypothetical protein
MKRVVCIETHDGKIHPDIQHARGHLKNMMAVECESLRGSFVKWSEHPAEFAEYVEQNIERLVRINCIKDDLEHVEEA